MSRVLLALALLLFVVAPLAAAQTMNVSWQWLLNDSEVTHYRYQLNGTEDGAWTVLDGKTDTVTLTGLDPYKDYTLYLQCSYDGENWSESASSTAKAMLEAPAVVEETPAAGEEVTVEPVAAEATEAASSEVVVAPVAESSSAAAVEAPASRTPYNFTVVDVEVSGEYGDKYFDSYIGLKGFVSSSDIQEFVAYEAAKYGDMLNGIVYEIVEDGIVLTIPEGIDAGLYLDSYKADIVEFLASVFTPVEGTKAEAVVGVAAAEAPAASGIQPVNYSFSVDGITVAGTIGDGCADAYTLQKGILTSDDIMGFVAYENAKYGSFFSDVYVTIVEDGFVLSFTEGVDVTGYAPAFEAEVEEYLASFVAVAPAEAAPEASAAEPVEVPAAVDNVRYKDVPVETEAEAPAAVALKEKTSSVKISLGLNGSVQTRVTREGIGDYWLRGGLNVEAKNIYMVGNFGFGARVDGTVALRSAAGWGTFLRDPSSWIHFSSYLKEASIDAMLMGYLNYDKVTFYGGLGVGYGVANVNTYMNSSKRVNILGHEWYQGYCFTGVGGLSYDINEKFALKVEGQARYVKTAGKSLSLALGGSYTF